MKHFAILLISILAGPMLFFPASGKSLHREPLAICHEWDYIEADLSGFPPGDIHFEINRGEPAWKFTGLVTAKCSLDFMGGRFDLIEVSYTDVGADFSVWAATGVARSDGSYLSTLTTSEREMLLGTLVTVFVQGSHISLDGVDWSQCDTELCHTAEFVDVIGGFSSTQMMIEGSYPSSSYPAYGFLFWEIRPQSTFHDTGQQGIPLEVHCRWYHSQPRPR